MEKYGFKNHPIKTRKMVNRFSNNEISIPYDDMISLRKSGKLNLGMDDELATKIAEFLILAIIVPLVILFATKWVMKGFENK